MANALARETSPYLLQHADNPVEWYPWSAAALEKARSENKPILLSIGYSACHWCHVMAHESFEDPETAALMNRTYVNIKVDREERPDLDRIYQLAHQLYTGRAGGWPLTVFLTPDTHVPIVVATYFPKTPRHGMPSFKQVLTQVEAYYRSRADEIRHRGDSLLEAFGRMETIEGIAPEALSDAPLRAASERLSAAFDREHGGFGGAPKFPRASSLELLLEQSRRRHGEALLHIVTHSLDRMALGGLHDQLGGGFFRYSVDRRWSIPHFEKMLYDNAELLVLYADAFSATGRPLYAKVAAETAGWVMREMQDGSGGYYSALDADADGREGAYYIWTREQFDDALSPEEAEVAKRVYGLLREANFEDPHTGDRAWHLHIAETPESINANADTEIDGVTPLLEDARGKLLAARERRVRPGRDEKVLAGWNGLMIRGMARAARRLGRADLAASATRAADFIRERLWRKGRLLATYKDGRGRFAAYLDDYAFAADGLLELLQCRWRSEDLDLATALTDAALAHFEDPAGGFFFTADDHEKLIHRPKSFTDEALPSGNGVLCRALLTLGHLLGEPRYLHAAERGLAAAMPSVVQHPDAHAAVLLALERYLEPPESIIVRAGPDMLDRCRALLDRGHFPQRAGFVIPADATALPGLLAERIGHDEPVAYICRGTECLAPVVGLDAIADALRAGSERGEDQEDGSASISYRRQS